MKEFLLIFRNDIAANKMQPSPEQMQAIMKAWQDWMGSIAAQNKLANTGNRLASSGKTVMTDGMVTDGPYVEIKEAIGGYMIVKTDTLEEATELAKGCPILNNGGSVEIRLCVAMDDNS